MPPDPSDLSYWHRVALAAEAATLVRPLFDEAWPEASDDHRAAVDAAIGLAARSAAVRRAADGLEEAEADARQVFMQAQGQAMVAAFAAKAAEVAARAAAIPESMSGCGSFYFALDAAREAGRDDLTERLQAALEARLGRG